MYCFIDSFYDDGFGAAFGLAGGSSPDHFLGVRSQLTGVDVVRT
jgi:hypothetical protein